MVCFTGRTLFVSTSNDDALGALVLFLLKERQCVFHSSDVLRVWLFGAVGWAGDDILVESALARSRLGRVSAVNGLHRSGTAGSSLYGYGIFWHERRIAVRVWYFYVPSKSCRGREKIHVVRPFLPLCCGYAGWSWSSWCSRLLTGNQIDFNGHSQKEWKFWNTAEHVLQWMIVWAGSRLLLSSPQGMQMTWVYWKLVVVTSWSAPTLYVRLIMRSSSTSAWEPKSLYSLTWAGTTPLWRCPGLQMSVNCIDPARKKLAGVFNMAWVEIPANSVFERHGHLQHAVASWNLRHALQYRPNVILECVGS